jgi:hypothetical protein
MPNNTKDPSEYRKRAAHCREQAAATNDPKSKEFWLRTAEYWTKMAESAEQTQQK